MAGGGGGSILNPNLSMPILKLPSINSERKPQTLKRKLKEPWCMAGS